MCLVFLDGEIRLELAKDRGALEVGHGDRLGAGIRFDAEHFGYSLNADALLQFAKVDLLGHRILPSLREQIVRGGEPRLGVINTARRRSSFDFHHAGRTIVNPDGRKARPAPVGQMIERLAEVHAAGLFASCRACRLRCGRSFVRAACCRRCAAAKAMRLRLYHQRCQ